MGELLEGAAAGVAVSDSVARQPSRFLVGVALGWLGGVSQISSTPTVLGVAGDFALERSNIMRETLGVAEAVAPFGAAVPNRAKAAMRTCASA
mmetsp:Transcript_14116/g.21960  ORF Transcript_14116/g.21960 Transcript_14116/m.21960 type:complete len:93 (+) Transcript_14116:729-1007(+)